jgi:hypothetical protein
MGTAVLVLEILAIMLALIPIVGFVSYPGRTWNHLRPGRCSPGKKGARY